jgi:hypothetical protein
VKFLYTLHEGNREFRFRFARLAESPQAAAAAWGGTFTERPDGLSSVMLMDEFGLCGTVTFGPELFREMTSDDEALAGFLPGNVVYTKNGMALLGYRGHGQTFTIRQHGVIV